ncbi:beta-lactamase family protein [Paracoccus sp. Z118]|uniref:serine hydrolase domain-containing protein n=1 Tax=Paracoccus sp. Z118 TaxID=2851017 RepID=UPI001C2B95E5|nr:serine hydrolase [Paracoccus sp. Z118]MBV0891104.1 beta-lactamase family protein [Paracoccus sp. Z118]
MPVILSRRAMLQGAAAALLPVGAAAQPMPDWAETAAGLEQLHALVVNRGGSQLFGRAFRGPPLDRPVNVKSVSKTILALLTGIAIDKGILTGTDQLVLPLLGRSPTGDARNGLTVGHLLSMQTGLASTSGANYGAWVASRDWVEAALSEPEGQPGGRFIYSTGGWHVLGAALSRASGESLLALAREWLGEPLDIRIPPWVQDPQGRYLGGNEMALSPLALARIGDMVLAGGQIDGRRVVSTAWLQTSWQSRARSPFSGDQYGYGWFLTRFAGHQAAYARGYGGQMLVVIPDLGASIAITSDPTEPARSEGHFGDLRTLVQEIAAGLKRE